MTERSIDLNADMGEYADETQRAVEAALMALVSSCSIACGGHAGDDETMRETARLARAHDVSVGAHPSYPDPEGFGRRSLEIDGAALEASLTAQIADLKSVLDTKEIPLAHVKPHGALYNDAAKDPALAEIIVNATRSASGGAIVVGPPGSAVETAARAAGQAFAAEGFIDRLYLSSGALTPRATPGAIIEGAKKRARQALAIARGEDFDAADGKLRLAVKTLCIHSDSPGAVETAAAARAVLEADSFQIRSF